MKTKLVYLSLLLIGLTMACKKDTLTTFDDKSSTNSIYFTLADTTNRYDFSFGYAKTFVKDSTIRIVVRAIGNNFDTDRPYNLSIADSSTLKPGLHYDFLNKEFSIKAGKVADTLKLKLKRALEMKKDSFFLYMDLKPNEHFSNQYFSREEISGGKRVIKYQTRLRLKVDDIAGVPWFWGKGPGASFFNSYLGTFGTNKFQLLISRYNLDTDKITAVNYNPPISQAIGWANGMKAYLDQMANMGTPVYETDGTLMKMGPSAQ
uniref:DUF4843 domain-containing protein n=1 Tax=Pedobacter schmidteae TaxID=2201271 RepID=UPI000EACA61D|nr:DUF4843 domain-containing protein [Pedobacter schmidteae]